MTGDIPSKPRPVLWGALFVINMAIIVALQIFELVEMPTLAILFVLNFGLMVPMIRDARKAQEAKGAMSPALRTYNHRVLASGMIYMVVMLVGANMFRHLPEGSPLLWLLAIVPLVPLLVTIWAMYRYLADESDEYLLHRAIVGALTGLALVLVIGTVWGFFEMYGLVPHVWNWWVLPVWAMGLGVGMCFNRRSEEESNP